MGAGARGRKQSGSTAGLLHLATLPPLTFQDTVETPSPHRFRLLQHAPHPSRTNPILDACRATTPAPAGPDSILIGDLLFLPFLGSPLESL
jgi:hypothetical protein